MATETPSALELPGDERDDLSHDSRRRLVHRGPPMCSVGCLDRRPQGEDLVRHDAPAAKRDDPRGNVDMNLLRLGVELESADVEIDLVVRIRRRPVDPAREPGVLKTLR